jgi:hypothetical protein
MRLLTGLRVVGPPGTADVRVADPYIYAPALAEITVRFCRDGRKTAAVRGCQDAGGSYDHVAAELRAGRKASPWMWFVVPQIAGLGCSRASRTYAITSLDEARGLTGPSGFPVRG